MLKTIQKQNYKDISLDRHLMTRIRTIRTMAEYIRRDTLIKRFFEKVDMSERIINEVNAERFSTFEALMEVVMDMPTIDIEEEDK